MATAPAHLPCLPVLLDAGAALDACDELGRTPLAVAVTAGHTDVVRTLLAAGADPDGATGTPPLALCLEPGVAAVLLDAGASPSARDHGVPVLVRAAGHGRAAVVGILIAAGAHAPELDSSGRNALHHAAATDSAATVQRLLDAGTDPSLPPLPTLIAAEEGSVEVLRTLLAAGAPTGRPGAPIAETALGVALRMGRWEHVALLRGLADRTT